MKLSRTNTQRTFLFSILILCMISGCTSLSKTQVPLVAPPPPTLPLTKNTIATFLASTTQGLTSMKASGTISLYNDGEELLSVPCVLMYRSPDKLYLRGYKPLAPNIFTVISTTDLFWLFVPEEKMIATGRHAALLENDEYNVNIIPEFLLPALFPQPLHTDAHIAVTQTGNSHTVSIASLKNGLLSQERALTLSGDYHDGIQETYWRKGIRFFEIKRTDFTHTLIPSFRMAQTITIRNLVYGGEIHLSLKELLVNVPVDDTAFEFYYPAGIDVERVE